MKRSEMLPTAIAAGSDLFLFFNDPDEDFEWMMEGYKNGIITTAMKAKTAGPAKARNSPVFFKDSFFLFIIPSLNRRIAAADATADSSYHQPFKLCMSIESVRNYFASPVQ